MTKRSKATKAKVKYVHVIEKKTGKSVKAIKCDRYPPDRVAAGISINMNSDEYKLLISDSPNHPRKKS